MVGDGLGNQSVQARMAWRRRHPRGGSVSSGSAIVTAFAPVSARSLGGSPRVDVDCGLHRRHLEDGTCVGSWFVDGRYGFLLRRLSRGGVSDLEFDGVFRMLPRSDSFNGKGFTFGEPPWRSAKLHISDGAASSSGEEVIHHSFLWWLLSWCRRQVMGVGVKLRDVLLSFQYYHAGRYVTCTIFMI